MRLFLDRWTFFVIRADDDFETALPKKIVVFKALLLSAGALIWGGISLSLGKTMSSLIPFGYVFLTAINLLILYKYDWFVFVRSLQTAASILLPFIFQWCLGGFFASGGVMIWSLVSASASLSYSSRNEGVFWIIIYVILISISGVYDHQFMMWFPAEIHKNDSIALLSTNFGLVSLIIFVLFIFFLRENQKAYNTIEANQQELIKSSKMAVIGQLSANIAHEINTPLGSIKSLAQESLGSGITIARYLFELQKLLDPHQWNELIQFILCHELERSYISTKEKRALRQSLEHELTQLGYTHAHTLAQQLCQINIYAMPNRLKSIPPQHFPEVSQLLHLIFMAEKNNNNITIASEKVSTIVRSLKMYIHTNDVAHPATIKLRESIETVLMIYQSQLKQGVSVQLQIDENIEVLGFADQISQVWTNLIVNACQAMNYQGELIIAAQKTDQGVIVSVEDTGSGIPIEIQPKIFEPLFTTKPIGEGSGLGLDIIKNIVTQHHGKIYFQSELGKGTIFFVELPTMQIQNPGRII